jgi:hypothetical protein
MAAIEEKKLHTAVLMRQITSKNSPWPRREQMLRFWRGVLADRAGLTIKITFDV